MVRLKSVLADYERGKIKLTKTGMMNAGKMHVKVHVVTCANDKLFSIRESEDD